MKRVIKNKSPIGKPWLAVSGEFKIQPLAFAKFGRDAKPRWETTLVLGEFSTKTAAEEYIK